MEKTQELKIVIYTEDNGTIKDKTAYILEKDSTGIKIQLFDNRENKEIGVPFFLPWHKVSKIKDVVNKNE